MTLDGLMDSPLFLPYDVFYDPYLGNGSKGLYAMIFSLCKNNKEGKCLASNKYLSMFLFVTTQTISNNISELTKRGYLSITYETDFTTGSRSRVIRINMDKLSYDNQEIKDLSWEECIDYFIEKAIREYRGFIYFLLADNGLTKIGFSTQSVNERKNPIDRALPYDTKLITEIKVREPRKAEELFHELFKDKRVRGEWFRFSPSDLFKIKKRRLPEVLKRLMA